MTCTTYVLIFHTKKMLDNVDMEKNFCIVWQIVHQTSLTYFTFS